MPARGDGLAMLKWISSFPGNPERGLPTVMGVVVLSDARDERAARAARRAVGDGAAHGRGRGGGGAGAGASRARRRAGSSAAGCTGRGRRAAWWPRATAPGVCHDPRAEVAAALAAELGDGWRAGTLAEALACDVVTCVTPGAAPVVGVDDLRPGLHLNMLGADGPGKAEATIEAVAACELYCDEWAQASHGGELTGAVEAGLVTREDVVDLGAVLGRRRAAAARGARHAVRLHRPRDPGPGDRRRRCCGRWRGGRDGRSSAVSPRAVLGQWRRRDARPHSPAEFRVRDAPVASRRQSREELSIGALWRCTGRGARCRRSPRR